MDLSQNRFFACVLSGDHLWTALAYGEQNPVRAGMVVQAAGAVQRKRFRFADYRWSSAKAHFSGKDELGTLDT